jgi:hypothetical protein
VIKHDVAKWIGMYQQVLHINQSGSNTTDLLRKTRELYRVKSKNNTDFAFELCWMLVKDLPKWADGWNVAKVPIPKKKVQSSNFDSDCVVVEEPLDSMVIAEVIENHKRFRSRPSGMKAAKEVQYQGKVREAAMYAQAEAAKTMAATTMRKNALLEDQNIVMLMTLPDSQVSVEAREYLRLRRREELKKLQSRLLEEELQKEQVELR